MYGDVYENKDAKTNACNVANSKAIFRIYNNNKKLIITNSQTNKSVF